MPSPGDTRVTDDSDELSVGPLEEPTEELADMSQDSVESHDALEVHLSGISESALLQTEVEEETTKLLLERANEEVTNSDLDLDKTLKLGKLNHQKNRLVRPKSSQERAYNSQYARLYSKELHEFATGEVPAEESLVCSRVSTQGSISTDILFPGYDDKSQSFDDYSREAMAVKVLEGSHVGGSFWAIDEKERFFNYLGRRSRHNMLGVSQGVRTKSVIECEEYYNLLLRATQQYFHHDPVNRANYGIEMKDIPAALEMSEEWIEMEERQAESMNIFERRTALNVNRYHMPVQVEPIVLNTWRSTARRLPRGNNPNLILAKDFDSNDSLIDLTKLFFLNNRIFRTAPYDCHLLSPDYDVSRKDGISAELITDLEGTIKDMMRSAIRHILNTSSGKRGFISKADVVSSLMSLGYPLNAHQYWHDYPRRSRTLVTEPIPCTNKDSYYDEIEKCLPVENVLANVNRDQATIYAIQTGAQPITSPLKDKFGPIKKGREERKLKTKELDKSVTAKWKDMLTSVFAPESDSSESSGDSSSESSDSGTDSDANSDAVSMELSDDSGTGTEMGAEYITASDSEMVQNANDSFVMFPSEGGQPAAAIYFNSAKQPSLRNSEPSDPLDSDSGSASYSSDSEDGFDLKWQVNQAEKSIRKEELVPHIDLLHWEEEKALEEHDMKVSQDDEYVTLVWLNVGPQLSATSDKTEVLQRIAERRALAGPRYRDTLRYLLAAGFLEKVGYNVKKRILEEMEEEISAEAKEAERNVKRQRFMDEMKEWNEEKETKYYTRRREYRQFLHSFPEVACKGIAVSRVSSRYEAK